MKRAGRDYRTIFIHPANHAGYYPGAEAMTLKLLFDPSGGRILGGQAVGGNGVEDGGVAGGLAADVLNDDDALGTARETGQGAEDRDGDWEGVHSR